MANRGSDAELRALIDQRALEARSLRAFRQQILEIIATRVASFDAAVFHALSPRVPLDTGAFVGIDLSQLAASQLRWDDFAVQLGALRDLANKHTVATDRDAFAVGTRARQRFEKHFASVFGTPSVCIAHLFLRGAVRAAIVLLSRKRTGFSAASVELLRALTPAIAIADALHEQLDRAPQASADVRLQCRDTRLTERQRAIVELVAMGQSNEDIASALGISANTARNHLARIFARVGAANRAELVRLAVLTHPARGVAAERSTTREASPAPTDARSLAPSRDRTRARSALRTR